MTYIIRANNKDYGVSDHASRRMIERFILEEMVIETLERGIVTEQPHGTDRYEYEIYDAALEDTIMMYVVVDENNRIIVSVVDDTEAM